MREQSISALVMHFKVLQAKVLTFFASCLCICLMCCTTHAGAGVLIDRIIASVNDSAITLSEFRERLAAVRTALPKATEDEVLQSMINGILILDKARQMRLEARNADDLIAEYINVRIRAGVLIRDEEIDRYFQEHRSEFGKQMNSTTRAQIEELLTEQEVNRALEKHLKELRSGAAISIQLEATK